MVSGSGSSSVTGGDDAAGVLDVLDCVHRSRARSRRNANRNRRQIRTYLPQRLVWDREDGVPERRFILPLEPIETEVPGEELRHVGGNPRRDVDAVGDEVNGTLGSWRPRDSGPHVARHLGVQAADGVDRARRPHRQRRHVELGPRRCRATESEKPVAVRTECAPAARQMLLD